MRLGRDSSPFGRHDGRLPQLESLELRAMMWNALGSLDGYDGDVFLDPSADVSTEDGTVVQQGISTDPLPVIPFDHSVSPIKECPGLPPELCLPGDLDGSQSIDFPDFLLLSANFGIEDATLQDGDLTGDGIVSFADFLILSGNYGKTA